MKIPFRNILVSDKGIFFDIIQELVYYVQYLVYFKENIYAFHFLVTF